MNDPNKAPEDMAVSRGSINSQHTDEVFSWGRYITHIILVRCATCDCCCVCCVMLHCVVLLIVFLVVWKVVRESLNEMGIPMEKERATLGEILQEMAEMKETQNKAITAVMSSFRNRSVW